MDTEADAEEDVATARPGQAAAAIAVMGLAVALAVLPAVIGFGLASGQVGQVAAGLGSLVAVVGGVKLAAVTWGLAARLASGPGPRVPAAAGD